MFIKILVNNKKVAEMGFKEPLSESEETKLIAEIQKKYGNRAEIVEMTEDEAIKTINGYENIYGL